MKDRSQSHERPGKTREEFLALFPEMTDWLGSMETLHGLFERIAALTLPRQRHVTLICFAHAWAISIYNKAMPPDVGVHNELSCVLSQDVMAALIGLHTILKPQDDTIWDQLIVALTVAQEEVPHGLQ